MQTGNYTKFALALGGNLGEVEKSFALAVSELTASGAREMRLSRCFRTAPEGCVPGTPDFCNAAATGLWPGDAQALLAELQRIERLAGRPARHSSAESRTLDLDIILFGDKRLNRPELTIPHPRAQRRGFVLEPLAELAPDWRFPDSLLSVAECLRNLGKKN